MNILEALKSTEKDVCVSTEECWLVREGKFYVVRETETNILLVKTELEEIAVRALMTGERIL
jgi:hypothetical protein